MLLGHGLFRHLEGGPPTAPACPRCRPYRPYRRTLALLRHGTNPYGETLEELLEQARGVRVGRPRPRYSNLGYELLGHALAAAAGTTYPALLRERVVRPLGLDDAVREFAVGGGGLGGVTLLSVGEVRVRRGVTLLSAPGIGALDPVVPFGSDARIGAAWITLSVKGRTVTWHNGGTGGFRSWLGLDRDAGTGVALLSATSASVDRQDFALLADQ